MHTSKYVIYFHSMSLLTTIRRENGFADKGMALIQTWIDGHSCTQWCKDIGLEPFKKPLRSLALKPLDINRLPRLRKDLSNLMNPKTKEEPVVIDLNFP